MRIVLPLAIMFAVIVPSADCGAAEVIGAGIDSCGRWISDRAIPRSPDAIQDQQWVLGYLSAIGQMSNRDPLAGVDAFAVWAWIDNFCRANPVARILEAAEAFNGSRPGR